jgi:MscS family membrane protein
VSLKERDFIIKQLFIFLSIFIVSVTYLNAKYQPWIEKQLALTYKMDEHNITQEQIKNLADEEHIFYDEILEVILLNKKNFLNNPRKYDKEIFDLERMIRINKRVGNKFAVLRDEVQIKSYQVIHDQNKMVRKIFEALDYYSIDAFEVKMNNLFAENQLAVHALTDVDYKPYLAISKQDKRLKEAQKNIKDFYGLLEINRNILKYLSVSEKKVYRLNKYAKYNVLSTVLYLNKIPLVKSINPWLAFLG